MQYNNIMTLVIMILYRFFLKYILHIIKHQFIVAKFLGFFLKKKLKSYINIRFHLKRIFDGVKKQWEHSKSCHCKNLHSPRSSQGAKTDVLLYKNPSYFTMFPNMTLSQTLCVNLDTRTMVMNVEKEESTYHFAYQSLTLKQVNISNINVYMFQLSVLSRFYFSQICCIFMDGKQNDQAYLIGYTRLDSYS